MHGMLACPSILTCYKGLPAAACCCRRREAHKAASKLAGQLRSYQQQVVQMAQTNAHLIVVMPTGAGKTLIAIEHSAWVLKADPQQRVVFLAPTVALAQQQAGGCLGRLLGATGPPGSLSGS